MARYHFIVALMIASAPAFAADGPSMQTFTPMGFSIGSRVDLSISGKNLADATLWTNLHPAPSIEVADDGKNKDTRKFRLRLVAGTSPGIYGLRMVGSGGLSNLGLFMVDDLATVREAGQHATQPTAQELTLPIAVEGSVETESYDWFTFTASAGQRLSFDVIARRLGSPLDPVLRLLDERGRELAFCDDDASVAPDCRFSHHFAEAGSYWLELRDSRYGGGKEDRYRLRIGDFPLVSATWPLAVNVKSPKLPTPVGTQLDASRSLDWALPKERTEAIVTLPVRYTKGNASSLMRLLMTDGLEQLEVEPNDKSTAATPIEIEGGINGRIQITRDRDFYSFRAKRDQRIAFGSTTRRLGAPTHLRMQVFDAKGKSLAFADDEGIDEPTLVFKALEDGEYRLLVEELLQQGGDDYVYRIAVQKLGEYFELTTDSDRYVAAAGGTFKVKVLTDRKRFKNPITLAVVGDDGEEWKLDETRLAGGKGDMTVTVTLPQQYKSSDVVRFDLVGRDANDKNASPMPVNVMSTVRSQLNGLTFPPPELTRGLWVAVQGSKKDESPKDDKRDAKK